MGDSEFRRKEKTDEDMDSFDKDEKAEDDLKSIGESVIRTGNTINANFQAIGPENAKGKDGQTEIATTLISKVGQKTDNDMNSIDKNKKIDDDLKSIQRKDDEEFIQ